MHPPSVYKSPSEGKGQLCPVLPWLLAAPPTEPRRDKDRASPGKQPRDGQRWGLLLRQPVAPALGSRGGEQKPHSPGEAALASFPVSSGLLVQEGFCFHFNTSMPMSSALSLCFWLQ